METSDTTDKSKKLTRNYYQYVMNSDGTITFSDKSSQAYSEFVQVVYYNDTEIL